MCRVKVFLCIAEEDPSAVIPGVLSGAAGLIHQVRVVCGHGTPPKEQVGSMSMVAMLP